VTQPARPPTVPKQAVTKDERKIKPYFIAKYAQIEHFKQLPYKYCAMKLIIYRVKHMNLQIMCADNVCQIENLKAINRHI